jgi:hypothetical protein
MDSGKKGATPQESPDSTAGPPKKPSFKELVEDITFRAGWVVAGLTLLGVTAIPATVAGLDVGNADFRFLLGVAIATWPLTAVVFIFTLGFLRRWSPGYAEFMVWLGICLFVPAYFGTWVGLGKALSFQDLADMMGRQKIHPIMVPLALLGFYLDIYGWKAFVASFVVGIFFAWVWAMRLGPYLGDKVQALSGRGARS